MIITKLFNFNEKLLEFKIPNGSDWKCTCLAIIVHRIEKTRGRCSCGVRRRYSGWLVPDSQGSKCQSTDISALVDETHHAVSKRRAPLAYWRGATTQKNGDLPPPPQKNSLGTDLFSVRIQVFQVNCKWIARSQTFSVLGHHYRVFAELKVCGNHIVAGAPRRVKHDTCRGIQIVVLRTCL